MDLQGIFSMNLEPMEYGFCMEDTDTSKNRKVKMYIPKLMNSNDSNDPTKYEYYMNRNQLLNSNDTIPKNIKYNITVSNYIEIPLSPNSYKNTIIKKNERLLILIPNKNIQNMQIIEL